jgi:hypothetical protein
MLPAMGAFKRQGDVWMGVLVERPLLRAAAIAPSWTCALPTSSYPFGVSPWWSRWGLPP